MIRKYHNHILQTNPRHHEEEPQNNTVLTEGGGGGGGATYMWYSTDVRAE